MQTQVVTHKKALDQHVDALVKEILMRKQSPVSKLKSGNGFITYTPPRANYFPHIDVGIVTSTQAENSIIHASRAATLYIDFREPRFYIVPASAEGLPQARVNRNVKIRNPQKLIKVNPMLYAVLASEPQRSAKYDSLNPARFTKILLNYFRRNPPFDVIPDRP